MAGRSVREAICWRRLRFGLLLLPLVLLTACSTTRLLYNNLDWLSYRRLDAQFAIRADQQAWIQDQIAELHGWHRATQLPAYRETLDALLRRYGDGLQPADYRWFMGRLDAHRQAFLERVIPVLALFLADLDADQLAHYATVAAADLEEMAAPLSMAADRRIAERLELFRARIEPWTGKLATTQVAALRSDLHGYPDWLAAWVELRQTRTRAFVAFLGTRPSAAAIESLLRWWFNFEQSAPPDYVQVRIAAWQRTGEILLQLDERLDATQRGQVLKQLRRYIADIDALTAAG